MMDVLERLRAANPVLDCLPPPIDGVWKRVESTDTLVSDRVKFSSLFRVAGGDGSRPWGTSSRSWRR